MPGDAEGRYRSQQRLLEPEDVFLHVDAEPLQVDQRVRDDLPRPVVRDLATAVRLHDRDAPRVEHVARAAGQALRVDRRVLAQPDLVSCRFAALGGERTHRIDGGGVVGAAEVANQRFAHAEPRLTARP